MPDAVEPGPNSQWAVSWAQIKQWRELEDCLAAAKARLEEMRAAADDYETALAKASWRGLTQDEHLMVEDAIRRARDAVKEK